MAILTGVMVSVAPAFFCNARRIQKRMARLKRRLGEAEEGFCFLSGMVVFRLVMVSPVLAAQVRNLQAVVV